MAADKGRFDLILDTLPFIHDLNPYIPMPTLRILLSQTPNLGDMTKLHGIGKFVERKYGYKLYHRTNRKAVEVTQPRHGRQRPFPALDLDAADVEDGDTQNAGPWV